MNSQKKNKNKKDDKINIEEKKLKNEIKTVKRTIDNNTHEVLEDLKLKTITSWRKSKTKFLKSLIYNILTFGIIHIVSLFYPKLYIKLYCNPYPPKECDFFLVENIYGEFTLCTKIYKKNKNKNELNYNYDISKDNIISSSNFNKKQKENFFSRNLTYSFIYKSMTYEYNEITDEINPVYLDLSYLTNKEIRNFFGDGLMTEETVNLVRERYGKNEYLININLLYLYFKRVELPSLITILVIGAFECYLKDYVSFVFKYVTVTGIFLFNYILNKSITLNINNKDNSIDGEMNDLKVRRKYLIDENNIFFEIKNEDLLPGDIIFLKSNDIVPCDCIIIEGECIANESNSTGNLDIFKKLPLENNNKKFNYLSSKVNILYHGMEIVTTFSKTNNGHVAALCINIGANTFKANQYSNILDLSDRKKEYREIYEYFGAGRKNIFITIVCIFFASLLFGYIYSLIFKLTLDLSNIPKFIISTLLRALCKSMMPMYFITNTIIILLSVHRLRRNNILCFDKSRLLNSGKIDTIFFSKTGTLCYNNFEINSYHPVSINPHKPTIINIKNYPESQCKEINFILEKYYQDYFYKKQSNSNNYYINNMTNRYSLITDNNSFIERATKNQNVVDYTVLFLECLLSCNNLEKFGSKIFGNIIEATIFNSMKWDIKSYNFDYEKEMENNNLKNLDSGLNINKNKNYLTKIFSIIQKRRTDIFPKNYYKITESLLNFEKKTKFQENMSSLESNYMEKTKNNNNLLESESNSSKNNPILDDITKSHIDSYILRIYKRFIGEGSFNSSSIVYNFMKKELRFMVKGIPEDIIDKCDCSTLPGNFDEIISLYRRNGLIMLICASKMLNVEEYDELNGIDFYMNDLTFCGFITLKNKIKYEIKSAIEDLKEFDCNLVITSGDNVNNSLSVGFDSGIIENKNIFVFDKDDEDNKISIRKIYSVKNNKEDKKEEDINSSSDKYSKITGKSQTKSNYSPTKSPFKHNYSFIRSSKSKKVVYKKNDSFLASQSKESTDLLTPQTPKLNFESHKYIKNRPIQKRNLRNYFKSSKNLLDNNFNFQKSTEKENLINRPLINSNSSEIIIKEEKEKIEKKDLIIKPRLSSVGIINLNDKMANAYINENKRRKKQSNKENDDANLSKRNYYNQEIKNKFLSYYQKFYFHPAVYRDNDELRENCIYCISGKLFTFLYENKKRRDYKYLLDKIYKYCKIFYNMTSSDKSLTIDYYREHDNSFICKIGECQSDFDPIMTSNVGINLRAPKNFNTILCHFYSIDSSISCIKSIILEGRICYENIFLLRILSIFCTMIINSYILNCYLKQIDVIMGQLNLLEISFLILSVTIFTGSPEVSSEPEPLVKNKKLFNIHYMAQLSIIIIFKLICIYLGGNLYSTNHLLEKADVNKIFCTYYFILCTEMIFSTSFAIFYISFYRKNILSNTFFMLFIILLLSYFIMLITLNSSNLRYDLFQLSYFEYFEYLIDSFDDRNRLIYFSICLGDFLLSFFYARLIYLIFNSIAKHKIEAKKE